MLIRALFFSLPYMLGAIALLLNSHNRREPVTPIPIATTTTRRQTCMGEKKWVLVKL
jgi:hypothetical protein